MELEFNERRASARDGELVLKKYQQQNTRYHYVWSRASAIHCCPYQTIVIWCSTLFTHIHGPKPSFKFGILVFEDFLSFLEIWMVERLDFPFHFTEWLPRKQRNNAWLPEKWWAICYTFRWLLNLRLRGNWSLNSRFHHTGV